MSRIGRITVAAIVLAAAGWVVVVWPSGFFENRARNALVARGTEILRQNKSNSTIVPLQDLFGSDIDGVCMVWNGPVVEDQMQSRSPAKFAPVIAAIAKMHAGEDVADSDTRYWVIHTVKGGAVLKTYSLAVRANLDLLRTDEAEDHCFDRNVAAQLNLYAAQNGEDNTLIVKVPAEPPRHGAVMAQVEAQKQALRRVARENRLSLARPGFAAEIARHADALGIATGTVVGGYHALGGEADPALLLERLAALGCRIAFPRVAGKALPLEFHFVPDGEALAPGAFGVHEPLATWPRAEPAALLVPLLAFDASGHRLGYGGGYYDRTLAVLHVPAIGIAYGGQQVASLPHQAHDRTLDMVLTEQGIRRFR